MGMLKAHIDAVEDHLLTISNIPANSGHSLHKGTPREAFIREFLQDHLSEQVAISTGEVIDADSHPGEQRNQHDIVLYRRNYPRLSFGGGVHGFLAESVVATIEVKSTLDAAGIGEAVSAAHRVKALKKSIVSSFTAGYQPPAVLSYVVAYDGPAQMKTVSGWIEKAQTDRGIVYPVMPATGAERPNVPAPSLDAVFVLGKGFLHFDNAPVGFATDEVRSARPGMRWMVGDTSHGSLLLLFLFLTMAVSGVSGSWLDPMPYLSGFRVDRLNTA